MLQNNFSELLLICLSLSLDGQWLCSYQVILYKVKASQVSGTVAN